MNVVPNTDYYTTAIEFSFMVVTRLSLSYIQIAGFEAQSSVNYFLTLMYLGCRAVLFVIYVRSRNELQWFCGLGFIIYSFILAFRIESK